MKTRLTEFFGIERPIVSAPMALISGGRLAAAVSSSEVRPAADIVADMASHAERILKQANDFVNGR
jgi:NAD(P)H-dependent flavin oxidoreductase YrpB (nitropropane dioxygenase family)